MKTPISVHMYRASCLVLGVLAPGPIESVAADFTRVASWELAVFGWTVWGVMTVFGWFARPISAVVIRISAPAALAITAVIATHSTTARVQLFVAVAVALVAAVSAFSPSTAEWFANTQSYGDEHRFLLRPPLVALVSLPIIVACGEAFIAWGARLVVDRNWIAAGITFCVGAVLIGLSINAGSRLLGRCAVLVPSGITLVDAIALTDPVLLSKQRVTTVTVLPTTTVSSDAVSDLGCGAIGPSLLVRLMVPVELGVVQKNQRDATMTESSAVRFVPTRPHHAAQMAAARGFKIANVNLAD